jgi:hypothetical protein
MALVFLALLTWAVVVVVVLMAQAGAIVLAVLVALV